MKSASKKMALCGVSAALAVVIMVLGGVVPVAIYVCQAICMAILYFVLSGCGRRLAWCWYGAVTILSLLLCPDKESSAVFLSIGYYPILKPWFDCKKLSWFWKLVWFNAVILALYWALMHLLGMEQIAEDFGKLGSVFTGIMLVLGDVVFLLNDRVLTMLMKKGQGYGKSK